MELKIEYLNPEDLTPYENNTRNHTPEDIEGIKESIKRAGFNDPIGIWGEKNLIVEGHGRQIAAIEMGLEKVPCIRLDHLTDEQRKEYAIRHNRSAEFSAWDFGKLEQELAELEMQGVDMEDLKFTFDGMANDLYVDDFFDRGVEAKEKPVVLGVKVVCGTKEQVDDVMEMLKEAGYNPEEL